MTALHHHFAAWPFAAGQFAAWSLLLFALASCPAALPAATFPQSGPEQAAADESGAAADAATDGQDAETFDACDWKLEGQPLQEQAQEVIRDWTCHSYRWFDGLFGDRRDFDETAINGLLTFGAEYTEYEGFDPKLRFKVRAPLPNMSSRWDLMLGRVDEESFVSDTTGQDRTFFNPGVIDRGEDASWLLGLGHRGGQGKSGWDYSLGVRLRVPPNPFGKVQYLFNHNFSERVDLRFRQTFFWRRDQGFGTTSRGDLAYAISLQNVLRWEGVGTVHDETRGTQWYFGQTWYHLFEGSNAISLRAFVRGETNAPVELQEYGLNLTWRRPFTRDWLYLSAGPSVTWPRELAEEERDLSLGFHVWLEMEFGDWRW
jgi:hypothetical protein